MAREGNPNLRGDAVAAALLAEAGVRAAAVLVEINTTAGGGSSTIASGTRESSLRGSPGPREGSRRRANGDMWLVVTLQVAGRAAAARKE